MRCAHAAVGLVELGPDGGVVAEMEEVVGWDWEDMGKETDPSKREFGRMRVARGLEDEDRSHPSLEPWSPGAWSPRSLELGVGAERVDRRCHSPNSAI